MKMFKQLMNHTILIFIFRIIGFILSFIMIPITLLLLGNLNYGIWITLVSIVSWIGYFDLGLANGLRNLLPKAFLEKDSYKINTLVSSSLFLFFFLSLFIFVFFSLIILLFNPLVILNIESYDINLIRLILLVNLLFISLNIFFSVNSSILYSAQKSWVLGFSQLINVVLNLLVLTLITYSPYFFDDILILSIGFGSTTTLINIMLTFYTLKRVIKFKFSISYIVFDTIKPIFKLSFRFLIIQLSSLVFFSTDNLLISNLFGPEFVTIVSIPTKLFSLFIQVTTIVTTPIWSLVTKKFIENDLIFIKKLILLLNWFFFFICISSVVLLINFDFIVSLWIGDDFLSIADYNVIINSFFFMLLIVWNNIYSTILSGISKINLGIYVTLFSSLVNIPLSIYLSKNTHFGLSGIILASNLLLIITSIISPIQVYYFIFSKTKKPFLDKLLS